MNHVLTSTGYMTHSIPQLYHVVPGKIGGHTHLFKNLRKIKQNDFHLQATGFLDQNTMQKGATTKT